MSTPTEVRNQLADLLKAAGLHGFAVIPAKAAPPFAYVAPGDPYLTYEGATFGAQVMRCNVGVVAGRGVNDEAAAEVDDLILQVLDLLEPHEDFNVGDVAQPGQVPVNGNTYLGTSVEVTIEIRRS